MAQITARNNIRKVADGSEIEGDLRSRNQKYFDSHYCQRQLDYYAGKQALPPQKCLS